MKITRIALLPMLLLIAASLSSVASATVVDDRLNARLDAYIAAPWPNPTDPTTDTWTWGQAGYALAVLKRYPAKGDLATAQKYIDNLCNAQNPIPSTGSNDTVEIWFKLPMIARMYLDPAMNNLLSAQNKANIERVMYQLIDGRSKWNDANFPWRVWGSDNHNMILKSTLLMACQIVKRSPTYGGSAIIHTDGKTVDVHLAQWMKWFFEYFRQRAREGLNCEIRSHGYTKYTLGGWYNVADLADDPNLRAIATDCLSLFWADLGCEFVPKTGLRAGAETRWYKTGIPDTGDSIGDVTYCYDLHDSVRSYHPYNIVMGASPYLPARHRPSPRRRPRPSALYAHHPSSRQGL